MLKKVFIVFKLSFFKGEGVIYTSIFVLNLYYYIIFCVKNAVCKFSNRLYMWNDLELDKSDSARFGFDIEQYLLFTLKSFYVVSL